MRLETRGWRLVKRRRGAFFFSSLVWFLVCLPFVAFAQHESSSVVLHVEAFDMPGDAGGSIGLRWPVLGRETSTSVYRVFLSEQETGEFTQITEFPAQTHYETDISGPWWVWGTKRKDVHFFQVTSTTDFRLDNDKTLLPEGDNK